MFILARALTYAVFFVGLVLIYFPARLLASTGVVRPEAMGPLQIVGIAISTVGVAVVAWGVLTFANIGRGTPAPFDPPRELVTLGPYNYVRNPMYIGAGFALGGAALFYQSLVLLGYTVGFWLLSHLFVMGYEEPALRRTFGQAYNAYCERVRRWWPAIPG
jgi:protein-S-isoprenylcysteine O-methyltransferase Ste14